MNLKLIGSNPFLSLLTDMHYVYSKSEILSKKCKYDVR